MRKRRSRLAKAGTIFLALVVALMLTGMGYGVWSDSLIIDATVEMGSWGGELSSGIPSENVTCTVGLKTLDLTITNTSAGADYYYKDFDIHNTGLVPIKIHSISISSPGQVITTVSGVHVDDVIDGDGTMLATVKMEVTVAGTYDDIQVTIDTVLWNQ